MITPKPPTNVYITVDVENAEERWIGKRFQPSMGFDLRMWGRFENQRRELGLPLIMDTVEENGLRGVFFLEPLGAHEFEEGGLEEVCQALLRRGHDIQVHTHPIQQNARYISRGGEKQSDDIGAYPLAEQIALLEKAKSLLVEAGVSPRDLVAFRAGNFGANNATWEALQQAGLSISSNYNPCYFDKNCKMRCDGAQNDLFPSPVAGVYELPVSCLREANGSYRHLQITALSADEMIDALWQSRHLGLEHVTIVTHSFEFYFIDSIKAQRGRPNSINIQRLRRLSEFLGANQADFSVGTMPELSARLAENPQVASSVPASFPGGKTALRRQRLAQQGLKRMHGAIGAFLG